MEQARASEAFDGNSRGDRPILLGMGTKTDSKRERLGKPLGRGIRANLSENSDEMKKGQIKKF